MDMPPITHAAPGADPASLREDDGEEPMMLGEDEESFNPKARRQLRDLFRRTRLVDDRTDPPGEDAPSGLGLFPARSALRSGASVLLFNSKQNPYKHYPSKAGRGSNLDGDQDDAGQGRRAAKQGGVLGARPATIDQRAGRDVSDLDYSFRPQAKEAETLELPQNLNLPNTADMTWSGQETAAAVGGGGGGVAGSSSDGGVGYAADTQVDLTSLLPTALNEMMRGNGVLSIEDVQPARPAAAAAAPQAQQPQQPAGTPAAAAPQAYGTNPPPPPSSQPPPGHQTQSWGAPAPAPAVPPPGVPPPGVPPPNGAPPGVAPYPGAQPGADQGYELPVGMGVAQAGEMPGMGVANAQDAGAGWGAQGEGGPGEDMGKGGGTYGDAGDQQVGNEENQAEAEAAAPAPAAGGTMGLLAEI